jgi:hypothetical protein
MEKDLVEHKDHLYLFELTFDEAARIVDTYKCQNIKEVLNYLDNTYGLDWDDLRFLNVERLRKG